MRRRLSNTEQIVDGNVVYFVRLEGSVNPDQLRSALARVQRKHPALRALIREESDGLYYEADSAPEVPLRIVPRINDEDYRRECQIELATVFTSDKPLLRAVWLPSERASDLLLTTSHRICDGASLLIIVREVLQSLYSDEELIPYQAITRRDLIGDYQAPEPLKRKLRAHLLNGLLWLIPSSRRAPENNEHYLEWRADQDFSSALKQRCKAEGVSVHAAFLVALDRALLAVFGEKKRPKWIENPVDIRRGRFAALKSDMVFFAGGNFKIETGQSRDVDFWARARTIHEEIRNKVEQELLDIPGRFHFAETLHPSTKGRVQWMVRFGDTLKMNGSWNRFALSNLGNIVVTDSNAPFRVKDLRLYMHSFSFRLLCLVSYTLNGEMRFYYVSDEKCMSRSQADALQREFMALLWNQVREVEDDASEPSRLLAAVAE